jgi:hypothetical protein
VGVRATTGGGTTDRSTEELILVGLSPQKLASQEFPIIAKLSTLYFVGVFRKIKEKDV